jgi:hypothetical protein
VLNHAMGSEGRMRWMQSEDDDVPCCCGCA